MSLPEVNPDARLMLAPMTVFEVFDGAVVALSVMVIVHWPLMELASRPPAAFFNAAMNDLNVPSSGWKYPPV